MKSNLKRAGGFSFAFVLLFSSLSVPVHAAETDMAYSAATELLARHTSGYGRVSSSLSRKIRELDDDPVEHLPIPILMGVSTKNLTKNFGDPRGDGTRTHEGLDIMAPKGVYVVSPTDAVVTSTGTGTNSGKYVYTANPGGERFAYMHLDAIEVKSGEVLKLGDLIGTVGNTGNASGGPPHLHFEIRDGREATDPYPRLTREFTLKERIAALGKIVTEADDEETEAKNIVALYRGSLIAARAQGIELSKELNDALGTTVGTVLAGGPQPFARDLTLGSRGDDVSSLQSYLIAEDKGPAAKALAAAGATGYFGPVTQAALIEYQKATSISPASGYFGPITRSHILSRI